MVWICFGAEPQGLMGLYTNTHSYTPDLLDSMVTSVFSPVVSTFSKDANPHQGLSWAREKIFCLYSQEIQSNPLHSVCVCDLKTLWKSISRTSEHTEAVQDKCCQYGPPCIIALQAEMKDWV